ncbi:hypothetical protein ACIOJE_27280 [Kitasatospora sp. NPDC087861]|uniref:hypothetical protein n=1 Tax=Kitasatospora sp. NPDC087861 TaxID=3364070 RepID=UPI003803A18E
MLTIARTTELAKLREQAAQAKDAAARESSARRELAKLGEQLRVALVEKKQAEAETARAEAEARAVLERVQADQVGVCAGLRCTIAELRAELQQLRSAQPTVREELPEHTVLRFRTVGGGTTVVTGKPSTYWSYCQDKNVHGHDYAWKCVTCGDDSSSYTSHDLADMRRRSNEHAASCRAIPAGPGDTADAEKTGARS